MSGNLAAIRPRISTVTEGTPRPGPLVLAAALALTSAAGGLLAGLPGYQAMPLAVISSVVMLSARALMQTRAHSVPLNPMRPLFAAAHGLFAASAAGIAFATGDEWSPRMHEWRVQGALLVIGMIVLAGGWLALPVPTSLLSGFVRVCDVLLPATLLGYAALLPISYTVPRAADAVDWAIVATLVVSAACAVTVIPMYRSGVASVRVEVTSQVARVACFASASTFAVGWGLASSGWSAAGWTLLAVAELGLLALLPSWAQSEASRHAQRQQSRTRLWALLVLAPVLLLLAVATSLFALSSLRLPPRVLAVVAGFGLALFVIRLAASLGVSDRQLAEADRNQRELTARANLDRLTGLPNRAAIEARLAEEFERARRYQQPLSLCMVDIDHFKAINDERGHLEGDAVLRDVATALRRTARSIDFVGRFGGEEFIVIAPGTWSEDGSTLANRLRDAVALIRPLGRAYELPITVSAGVAGYPEHATDPESLFVSADAALYEAKRAGRNRVCLARPI